LAIVPNYILSLRQTLKKVDNLLDYHTLREILSGFEKLKNIKKIRRTYA